ncbi:NADH dehydrogenase FAD-containing subunit [Micromonospora pisi]|uniref:NADH dehydrogenase FAD-containing subunit n=1 Tax=Micromonospora pisi TaxID=589240 RepID=A0A495JQ49_9ACTN|nr:FAD-dependent oxidoreductase [Micromonospora pisi]RKR90755.1 NADH dehydrogenase FAD-containing subunit [Micromonospora pisi]
MTEITRPRPKVAVIGGGFGGVRVAKGLDDIADVTLVDPSDAFLHNVASWRALVEPEWVDRIFLPYDRLLRHGRFVHDRAVAVDGRQVTLAGGERLEPDYLVLATGSSYPFPAKSDEARGATARARFRAAHQELRDARRVLVVGAGPSGLELAGEIKSFFPEKQVTVVDAGPDILPGPYEQALRDELRGQLDKLGVELRLGSPLRDLPSVTPATTAPVSVTTIGGEELDADIWYRCFGTGLQTDYLRGTLADTRDEQGYLRVDDQLRVVGQERIFALGDIADADTNLAGRAMQQADLLAANLRAEITGEGEITSYRRGPTVAVIPLGPDGGAGQLPWIEGIAGPEAVSEIKGRSMLVEMNSVLFDAPVGGDQS